MKNIGRLTSASHSQSFKRFEKLDYLFACDPTIQVFTDHRNLLFALLPVGMEPSLGRHKVLRDIRWALFLSAFNYRIEHVPGDYNIRPEIMTRWMRGYRRAPSVRRVTSALPFNGVTIPPESLDFEWPHSTDINTAQTEQKSIAPNSFKEDKIWTVPYQASSADTG